MTTFYSEVRDLAAINYSNPLAEYVQVALLPNQDSGQVVTELVQNEELTISGALTWNSDGSVSNAASGTTVGDTEAIALSRPVKLYYNNDFIYVLDYNRNGDDSTHASIVHIRGTENGDLRIERRASSNLYKVTLDWKGSEIFTQNITINSKTLLVFHWDGANKKYSIYVDGVKVAGSSVTGSVTDGEIDGRAVTEFSVGAGGDDFYHQALYVHPTGSFTQAEIDSLLANPYQIFETAATKRDEYGLAFDSSQSLDLDSLTGQVTIEFELGEDMPAYDAANPKVLCRSKDGTILGNVSLASNNEWAAVRGDIIEIYVNDVALNVATDWSIWNEYFIGDATTATLLTNAKANDVIRIRQNAIDSLIFGNRTDMLAGFAGLKVKWLKVTDDNGVNLWIFDKQGTHATIADEYNGAIATLNGFPEYAGYVYENGECVGYQFNGVDSYARLGNLPNFKNFEIETRCKGASAPSTSNGTGVFQNQKNGLIHWDSPSSNERGSFGVNDGSWKFVSFGELNGNEWYTLKVVCANGFATTYVNGIQQSQISVNNTNIQNNTGDANVAKHSINDVFWNGEVDYLKITDLDNPSNNAYYNFTTGDIDSIPDTVGNNHATIVNQSTSGFLPIIEKQVYTVGTGKDYASWGDFNNAHKTDNDVHLQVELFDVGHIIAGSTTHFNLVPYITYNYNEPVIFEAESSGNLINPNGFTRYVVNNLEVLNQGKQTLGTNAGVVEVTYNNLDMVCESAGSVRHLGSIQSKTTFNNSRIIQKNNDNVFEDATGELIVNNSIMLNEHEGTKRVFASAIPLKITNSIVSGLGNAVLEIESHCVSADASATGSGSLNNQPIDTWFVDASNNDYRINDTGQAVLKGAGWNDSDIASTFYAEASTPSGDISAAVTVNLPAFIASGTLDFAAPNYQASVTASMPAVKANVNVVFGVSPVTANISAQLPAFIASGTLDITAPNYQANVTAQLPAFNASALIDFTAPNYSATITAALPAFIASGNINIYIVGYSASVTAQLPPINASGYLTIDAPNYQASVTANLPSINTDAQASFIAPGYSAVVTAQLPPFTGSATTYFGFSDHLANISVNLPAVTASALVSFATPSYSASVTAQLPPFTASALLSISSPGYQANISANLPAFVASGTLDFAAPNYQASVTAQLPAITATIFYATPKEFAYGRYLSIDSAQTTLTIASYQQPLVIQ